MTATVPEGKKEACKTYIEQTKLLVALASVFLVAPVVFLTATRPPAGETVGGVAIALLIVSELSFILSVLFGYVVLGSVAGSQESGEFNIYRPATRTFSLLELGAYLLGLALFIALVVNVL